LQKFIFLPTKSDIIGRNCQFSNIPNTCGTQLVGFIKLAILKTDFQLTFCLLIQCMFSH